jgi:hypothetical protein
MQKKGARCKRIWHVHPAPWAHPKQERWRNLWAAVRKRKGGVVLYGEFQYTGIADLARPTCPSGAETALHRQADF